MKKTKKMKAWAIVEKDLSGVVYGGRCDFGNGHESFLAVFGSKREAYLAKKLHDIFYKDTKVVPATISFTLHKK